MKPNKPDGTHRATKYHEHYRANWVVSCRCRSSSDLISTVTLIYFKMLRDFSEF